MSRVIEDTLVRREIAYQVIGGTKFYERAEIKDAIAYLSLLANPFDVVSFTRVANSPRRGIGQTSLVARHRARRHARHLGVGGGRARPSRSPGSARPRSRRCGASWTRWTSCAPRGRPADGGGDAEQAAQPVPVGDLLEAVLVADAATSRRSRPSARSRRRAGSRTSSSSSRSAREFDAAAADGEDTLDVFLQQIALVADADTRSDDEGLVTLMTLHNAKGLEYPIVFIAGCEDGVFPHSRALDEGGLEEERRLFYVGVTRAMRELYLTYARRRAVFGAQSYGMRSRFLDEIPAELLDASTSRRLRAGCGRGRRSATVRRRARGRAARRASWAAAGAAGARRRGPLPARRGRRARRLRRGRRHGRGAGRRDRRALRRRRLRAQADGRVRARQPSLSASAPTCASA